MNRSEIEKSILVVIGYIVYLSIFISAILWCFFPTWSLFGTFLVINLLNENVPNKQINKELHKKGVKRGGKVRNRK